MIDGLALGETTPGPLIMVVTFVGFVGGWTHAATQGLTPGIAGLPGGLVVTFFTFLPSFVFIFAGAPLVEATRGLRQFTAPLTAMTAAVVGVIAQSRGLLRHARVLFRRVSPERRTGQSCPSPSAAALALFRFKAGVIPVILAAGGLGIVIRLSGG